jgi:hypothetical protein
MEKTTSSIVIKPLNKVAQVLNGANIKQKELTDIGGYPYITTNHIEVSGYKLEDVIYYVPNRIAFFSKEDVVTRKGDLLLFGTIDGVRWYVQKEDDPVCFPSKGITIIRSKYLAQITTFFSSEQGKTSLRTTCNIEKIQIPIFEHETLEDLSDLNIEAADEETLALLRKELTEVKQTFESLGKGKKDQTEVARLKDVNSRMQLKKLDIEFEPEPNYDELYTPAYLRKSLKLNEGYNSKSTFKPSTDKIKHKLDKECEDKDSEQKLAEVKEDNFENLDSVNEENLVYLSTNWESSGLLRSLKCEIKDVYPSNEVNEIKSLEQTLNKLDNNSFLLLKEFIEERFNKIETQLKEVSNKLDDVLSILQGLQKEISQIKALPRDEEERLSRIYLKIDEKFDSLVSKDQKSHEMYITEIKKWFEFWDDLEHTSKKFLPSAEFLYDEIYKLREAADFSPFVIQYCRTLENEILKKLFVAYHEVLLLNDIDRNELVRNDLASNKIKSFAEAILKDNREYTLGSMRHIMSQLNEDYESYHQSALLPSFKAFIRKYFEENVLEQKSVRFYLESA